MIADQSDRGSDVRGAEERFRLVVESSPAAIVIVNTDGRIVLVNEQVEKWFGYGRDELLGREVEQLVPERCHEQHRVDRDNFLAAPVSRPMGAGHELIARRQDGSEFPVDISLHPIETEDGALLMAHIVDLTDRRRASIETERRHALERLALLGQLAAGVAHEIRNPLGVIRNAAYYLQMIRETLDEEGQASISEIQQEVDKANHIVGDLLDFARDPPQQAQVFDVVGRIETLIAGRRGDSRTIQFTRPEQDVAVRADPEQVDQVLANLVRNAVQATSATDRIAVAILVESGVAAIEVSDSGAGITEADRERIFDPLFTTKAKGIGLGLTVSRRYAEQNGGRLALVDRPGPGATFRLRLPLAGSQAESRPETDSTFGD